MPKRKDFGRIWFHGNPWPNGHQINKFIWTARVERGTGIWFDLHLETAPYDAEDTPNNSNSDLETKDWNSKIVWCNYSSCSMSSTKWYGSGFLAATFEEPLDMGKIGSRKYSFDDQPKNLFAPRPFNIYLTGHDSVSGHRITFKPDKLKRTFSIEWKGKIAMLYAGSKEFKYSFTALLKNIIFEGIVFPHQMSNLEAFVYAEPYVHDIQSKWKFKRSKDSLRLVPANTTSR